MKITDKFLSAVVLTAAAAALCTSCSTDNLTAQQQGQGGTTAASITATLGETQTRTGINSGTDNTHTLYWHDSDQILVRTKSATDGSYSSVQFDIAEGTATGVTTATFKGLVGDNNQIDTYAVYPYDTDHAFTAENSLSFHLPSDYEYTTVETGIFPKNGAYRTTNTHVPMLGTISNGTASFKHLGGLLVIRIDKMPAASGEIVVTADQKLCGDFTVEDLSASDAKIVTESAGNSGSYNEIKFTYRNATKGGVGVFYLPVPTGEYTNLKINLEPNVDAIRGLATYGSLKVERADIIAIPIYQGTGGKYSCDYVVNGHKFIDLCLPSGLLWAETNVGAETAEDFGNYYAWGEITSKSNCNWSTYKWTSDNGSTFTKYTTNGKTVLDKEDDAAYMNWGSYCRMPTNDEFNELINNSTWTWDGDKKGYYIESKKNGNSIFLPAAYYRDGTYLFGEDSNGYYWSSSLRLDYSYCACGLFFSGSISSPYSGFGGRYAGQSVRPVAKTYNTMSSGSAVPDMNTSGFDTTWE